MAHIWFPLKNKPGNTKIEICIKTGNRARWAAKLGQGCRSYSFPRKEVHTHTAPNGNRQSGFLQMGRLLREDLGCVSAASTELAASPPDWNSSRWKVRSSKKNPLHCVLWRKPGLDKLFYHFKIKDHEYPLISTQILCGPWRNWGPKGSKQGLTLRKRQISDRSGSWHT